MIQVGRGDARAGAVAEGTGRTGHCTGFTRCYQQEANDLEISVFGTEWIAVLSVKAGREKQVAGSKPEKRRAVLDTWLVGRAGEERPPNPREEKRGSS